MTYKTLLTLFTAVMTLGQICHAQRYIAEGYFVVDNKAVKYYMKMTQGNDASTANRKVAIENIKKEMYQLLSEVNRLLSSLKEHGIEIEVRVRDLLILDTNVYGSNVNDSRDGLIHFRDWLHAHGVYSNFKYDFALLWTGYNLPRKNGYQILGSAQSRSICNPAWAVGQVDFKIGTFLATTTAHEIAHILGSGHDPAANDTIMGMSAHVNRTRRWSFSEGSASMIRKHVKKVGSKCLLRNRASLIPSTMWASYSSQLLNKDVACQWSLNHLNSFMCLSSSLYNNQTTKGDNVCHIIYCKVPGTSNCKPILTPEGMICDKNKRCQKGKCLPDTSAADIDTDADCVFGDQKRLDKLQTRGFSGTCQKYIRKRGKAVCYKKIIRKLCCATCKKYNTGPVGCEYGDRSKKCKKISEASGCSKKHKKCCARCSGFISKRSIRDYLRPNITILTPDVAESLFIEKDVGVEYEPVVYDDLVYEPVTYDDV